MITKFTNCLCLFWLIWQVARVIRKRQRGNGEKSEEKELQLRKRQTDKEKGELQNRIICYVFMLMAVTE